MPDLDLTEFEKRALEHEAESIKAYGRHELDSCPYLSRAMCGYARVLRDLEERGLR